MEILKLVYLAAGPGIAIGIYLYFSDKWEPEPKRMVALSFLLGGLACFPSHYFEGEFLKFFGWQELFSSESRPLWQTAFYAFFGVALAEELCKFLFLKGFIYDHREFSEPFDGIVYGGVAGCGFATVENLLYVLPGGYEVAIIRMLTAVPGHAFDGMILGYFMGKAKFCANSATNLTAGLALVVVLHGLYDTAAFSNEAVAIYLVFAILVLGIYLGLRAKKELARHSLFVESSLRKFFLIRNEKAKGPYFLKDIRDLFAKGVLKLEDTFKDTATGEEKSTRQLLCAEIGLKFRKRIKAPPRGQPAKQFFLIYGLTFGLYIYFWFHRIYREFRNYKNIDVNPEIRALAFFVLTVIPFILFGSILKYMGLSPSSTWAVTPFLVILAVIETAFVFYLMRMVKAFLHEKMQKSFTVLSIITLFFISSALRKLLPQDIPHYWWFEIGFIWLQGGILACVQKDLNRYWHLEGKRMDKPLGLLER